VPPVLAACPNTEPVLLEPKPAKKRKENNQNYYQGIRPLEEVTLVQNSERTGLPRQNTEIQMMLPNVPRLDKFKVYANIQIINSIESLSESHSPFLFSQLKKQTENKRPFHLRDCC